MNGSGNDGFVRWRADLAPVVVEGEAAYLVTELDVLVMEGPLVDRLVQLLDGTRRVSEVVAALSPEVPTERVRRVLDRLCDQGLVVVSGVGQGPRAAYWEAAGIDARVAEAGLSTSRVRVRDLSGLGASAHEQALLAAGARVSLDQDADLDVVLTEDYLEPELGEVNLEHLETGRPWLLARPVGRQLWTGPILVPGSSACWACLAHRLEDNRESHAYLSRRLGSLRPVAGPPIETPGAITVSAGLVALTAARHLAGAPGPTEVRTDDLVSGETTRHAVTRRPQCPVCGEPTMLARRGTEPIELARRPRAPGEDGGHRFLAPTVMLERYADQVSPITGVATGLVDQRGPHHSIHVVVSGQNVARRPGSLAALRRGLRSRACGKGVSEAQARASALGEAIERSSGVFQGDEPRRRASLAELGEDAIDPRECLLYSRRQYELRGIWNAGAAQFNFVCEPFDETAELDWSPVWSLTARRARWLPTQYLYYGYPYEQSPVVALSDSNGCAAGTSVEDAALQGVCELIERDSVALWWYNRVRRPAIDLDSLRDPYVDRLREIYYDLGREVWVLDLTADLGVPAVAALSRAISGEREEILLAFGAHLDPRVAVLRALTEMNQFLNSVLPEFGGGPPDYSGDAAFAAWCQSATVAAHPHLAADPNIAARDVATWASLSGGDLGGDLELCRARLEAKGLEVLVLDQTRPDVGLPVVKVIVPGLRHFWPRFAPGRLYDVPVELGWLERPTPEEALNPVGVFI